MLRRSGCGYRIEYRPVKECPEENLSVILEIEDERYLLNRRKLANMLRVFVIDSAKLPPMIEATRHIARPEPNRFLIRARPRVGRARIDGSAARNSGHGGQQTIECRGLQRELVLTDDGSFNL